MDYGHVLFIITACLLVVVSGAFDKPRVFSGSTTITKDDRPCPQEYLCLEPCRKDGKDGHCAAGFLSCYCKPYGEDNGSKYLQLAREMSMEKLRRTGMENMGQRNDEHLKL